MGYRALVMITCMYGRAPKESDQPSHRGSNGGHTLFPILRSNMFFIRFFSK